MNTNYSKPDNRVAELHGNKIAYRVFGHGPYLLFYNRFRGVMDTWDPLFLAQLSGHFQLVLFDYPGIGDSTGELPTDVTQVAQYGIDLMDLLGADKFYIIGWSYGGQIAQVALFENLHRVLKAVFIGTNPPGNNEIPFDRTFFELALRPSNDSDDETVLFFEPASEKSRDAASASHNRISAWLDRTKIPATQEIFQRYFTGAGMFREDKKQYRMQYASLEIPVLVISGDHDISFAVGNWFPLLRHAPSMQHLILNDSGHAPHHQQPELSGAYISLFLESVGRA